MQLLVKRHYIDQFIDDKCANCSVNCIENKGNSSVMNECVNICSSCKNHLCQTNSTNKSFSTNKTGKSPSDYPKQVCLNHKAMNQSNRSIQILNHNECKQQVPTEIAMNESNKSIQIQNHNECKQQVPTEIDMDTTGSPFAVKKPL